MQLAGPQQQDQNLPKEEGHLFLSLQLLALHLQLAGMLWRGLVLGTHLQALNGVVTRVLLRKERPSPLNKLAEQYSPKGLESEKPEAACPPGLTLNLAFCSQATLKLFFYSEREGGRVSSKQGKCHIGFGHRSAP